MGYEGNGWPVAYLVFSHHLLEEYVELARFRVVQRWTARRDVHRDVVDFSVIAGEGAANDAVDAMAFAEVSGEPLADQLLGGWIVRLLSFMPAPFGPG